MLCLVDVLLPYQNLAQQKETTVELRAMSYSESKSISIRTVQRKLKIKDMRIRIREPKWNLKKKHTCEWRVKNRTNVK